MIIPPKSDFTKDSFCGYCGSPFTEKVAWPRTCFICNIESYKNPIPVAVGLIRVFQRGTASQCGWLVEQRGIEPKKGEWALPSGYINFGEDWQTALARELQEEVGLVSVPGDYELYEIVNVSTTGNILIFGYHTRGVYADEVKFEVNSEVLAIKFPILPSHQELCFPSHNQMWSKCYHDKAVARGLCVIV